MSPGAVPPAPSLVSSDATELNAKFNQQTICVKVNSNSNKTYKQPMGSDAQLAPSVIIRDGGYFFTGKCPDGTSRRDIFTWMFQWFFRVGKFSGKVIFHRRGYFGGGIF